MAFKTQPDGSTKIMHALHWKKNNMIPMFCINYVMAGEMLTCSYALCGVCVVFL